MIAFERNSILPAMAERPDEPQLLFVKLLHQNGRNLGYNVLQYMPGQVPSRAFTHTNVMITIALENIRMWDELMQLYEERRRSSITDMLTNLLNRRGLMEKLESEWPGLVGREIAFVSVDMDRLKQINDTYGHAAGDAAIRLVGKAIQSTLPPGALGARIGGDEFAVFLPDGGGAEAYARSMEEALEGLNEAEKHGFTVSASVGYSVRTLRETDDIEQCILAGDQMMYVVKEAHHQN